MQKTKKIIITGMMAAVLSVLSILQIPMPTGVPITLQTFAVALCGYVLGAQLGGAAAGIYLLLGLIGVPVYAGFSAGAGVLLGMTGGFIFGFIPMAVLCGLGLHTGSKGAGMVRGILLGILGLAVCHLLGLLQFAFVTGTSVPQSFLLVSLPYLLKDILSVIGAALVAVPLRRALAKADLMNYTAKDKTAQA
jgi:biotin transport system substrate-specific component